ncbi:hypothetical protein ACOJR9_02615 [Alteromonas sp. A081]|uniref:hypothetical protein n=1 Tax=Alteromonas sp. A081 TaxID=3410269 RepID=UPI003B97DBD9
MDFLFVVVVLFAGFIFNVLPWLLALLSRKAIGSQKLIWFLMSFFISWLGYFVYYFFVIKPEWEKSNDKLRIPRTDTGIPIKNFGRKFK